MRKALSLLFGIMMIVDGVICVAMPGITFLTLGYMVGVGMVLDGIGRVVNWIQLHKEADVSIWILVSAILSLTLGIVLVGSEAMQLVVDAFIIDMAIVWLVAIGLMRIGYAFRIKKARSAIQGFHGDTTFGRHCWIALIFGVLMILCGITGMFVPSAVAETIGTLIGISIIISGANLVHFGTSSWMIY